MRWWEGLRAVEVAGPEGAEDHPVVWRDGELFLGAHPDPEAEQLLGVLGGERCPCLDVFEAWHAAHADGAILTVGSRHPSDAVWAPTDACRSLRADLRRWRSTAGALVEEARLGPGSATVDRLAAVVGPPERAAARRLGFLLLLGLDPVLLHRLQASVAHHLAGRPDGRELLAVATAARARPALEAIGWRGELCAIGLSSSGAAEISARSASLPPSWLASVWGRGLAGAADGAIVVEVEAVGAGGRFDVVAIAPGKAQVALRVAPVEE